MGRLCRPEAAPQLTSAVRQRMGGRLCVHETTATGTARAQGTVCRRTPAPFQSSPSPQEGSMARSPRKRPPGKDSLLKQMDARSWTAHHSGRPCLAHPQNKPFYTGQRLGGWVSEARQPMSLCPHDVMLPIRNLTGCRSCH